MGIEQVRELIELRFLVEPAFRRQGRYPGGAEQIKELRRAARAGGAGAEITAAANRLDMVYDANFHAMVADLAGNQMISNMLTRLRSHLHTFRLYYHAGLHSVTKNEHLAVVDAVAGKIPTGPRKRCVPTWSSALERLETFVVGGNATVRPGRSRTQGGASVPEATLSGQVALVTGGSRGLGKEFARALTGAGARVAVSPATRPNAMRRLC